MPICHCDSSSEELQQFYYELGNSCHELFTKGPCQFAGDLFLPTGRCGCHRHLPHFHPETHQCYKLGKYYLLDHGLTKEAKSILEINF